MLDCEWIVYHCFGLPSNCEAVLMVFKLLCCSLYVSQDHVGVYSEHQIKFSKVTAAVWHFDPHLLTGLQLYMHASMWHTCTLCAIWMHLHMFVCFASATVCWHQWRLFWMKSVALLRALCTVLYTHSQEEQKWQLSFAVSPSGKWTHLVRLILWNGGSLLTAMMPGWLTDRVLTLKEPWNSWPGMLSWLCDVNITCSDLRKCHAENHLDNAANCLWLLSEPSTMASLTRLHIVSLKDYNKHVRYML